MFIDCGWGGGRRRSGRECLCPSIDTMTSTSRVKANTSTVRKLETMMADFPAKSQAILATLHDDYPLSDYPAKPANATVIHVRVPTVPKNDTTTVGAGLTPIDEHPMRQVSVFEGTQVRTESYAGPIQSNAVILDMHNAVRKTVVQVAEDMHTVIILLKLCQLPLTSKDDFEYSVINEAIDTVRTQHMKMSDALDGMIMYYQQRASIIHGLLEQPHVQDVREGVTQTDVEEWRMTRQRLRVAAECYDLTTHVIKGVKGKLAGTDGPLDGYGYQ